MIRDGMMDSTRRERRWLSPVAVATGLAVASGLICALTAGPFRWLAGVLLVAYLPGRGVRVALRWTPPDAAVAAAVDVGLSLCCVVLAGMALNATPAGIELSTMLPALAGVAAVTPLTSLIRPSVSSDSRGRAEGRHLPKSHAAAIAVLVVLLVASLIIAVRSANFVALQVRTTDLSIAPRDSSTEAITVTNDEHTPETYRLVVAERSKSYLTDRMVIQSGRTQVVAVSTPGISAGRLTASLYMGSAASAFRRVWLQIPRTRSTSSQTP